MAAKQSDQSVNYLMIGFLSDAHGNLPAFQYGVALLKKLGATNIHFLGDAVGYIPRIDVVQELMETEYIKSCIMGNHEHMMLFDSCNQLEDIYQLKEIKQQLSDEMISFLSDWPTSKTVNCDAGSIMLVHGSPENPTFDYLYPDSDLSKYIPNTNFVVSGNSHYPFIKKVQDITYINVGSCGLPRDNGQFGAAAILDPNNGECRIIRFDIKKMTKNFLRQVDKLHPSVMKLLERRNDKNPVGEVHVL